MACHFPMTCHEMNGLPIPPEKTHNEKRPGKTQVNLMGRVKGKLFVIKKSYLNLFAP